MMKKLFIVMAFAAIGAMLHAQERQVVDGVVAVVGKNIIRHSDIEQAYAQIRLHQGVQNAHEERCALLENMLINKLLVHKGMIDSVEVTDDQVDEQVQYYLKAAVAQAYILVARPFPEGNERLSRMLSSAVLLRCGYDFFRDISLSAVIARESYRYYKSMREIIRAENGGDLTYFMEYFLELLARAIDDRKERLRRREQDTLEKEREMARQPLRPEPSDITNEPHAMNQARAAIMPTDPEPTDPKERQ